VALAERERDPALPAFERLPRAGWPGGRGSISADQLARLVGADLRRPSTRSSSARPARRVLLEACEASGVVLEAYSPLTCGHDLGHRVIVEIARRHGRTPAQVLLRWAVQRAILVILKSANHDRIVENAATFDLDAARGMAAGRPRPHRRTARRRPGPAPAALLGGRAQVAIRSSASAVVSGRW
jgi:hypothetical protein